MSTPKNTETTFVVKPSLQTYFKKAGWVRFGLVGLMIVAVNIWLGPAIFLLVTGGVLLLAILTLLQIKLSSLSVDGDTVRYHGWFGRRVTVKADDIAEVIYASNFMDFSFGQSKRLFALKKDGRPYFWLNGTYWSAENIEKVASYLESHSKYKEIKDPSDIVSLTHTHPVMLPFYERRPIASALIVWGIILVVYTGIFLIERFAF